MRNIPNITVADSEQVGSQKTGNSVILMFIAKVRYNVILWNPRGEDIVTLLLPFQIEITPNYFIVRFITLEKNLNVYYGHTNYFITQKSLDENKFLGLLQEAARGNIILSKADLHKGIKTLMKRDIIDASIAKIEKNNRTSTEKMHEGLGVKKDAPEVYNAFMQNGVHNSLFKYKSKDEKFSVKNFSSNLIEGTIDFSSYSERKGDTDHVIKEILRYN